MKEYIEKRVLEISNYILDTGDTVRNTAKKFKVSKSTVHKDITERLRIINISMYSKIEKILQKNKAERHLRGGKATHNKYKGRSKA